MKSMLTRISQVLLFCSLLFAAGAAMGADDADKITIKWSATVEAVATDNEPPDNQDDVTGFFDQFYYTPNKDDFFPLQLGISEASFDAFAAEETPLFQFRLNSPTSNLGVSGSDIDQPFLNQRANIFARPEHFQIDLDYRRMRTDDLRLFPGASGLPQLPTAGPGAVCPDCQIASFFNDDTSPTDRFYSTRSLIQGQIRFRPDEYSEGDGQKWGSDLVSEMVLRGGYESWTGNTQFRFMLGGSDRVKTPAPDAASNDWVRWRGISQEVDQEVSDIGGGLVLTPGGLFTLTLDVDQESFRNHEAPIMQTDLVVNSEYVNVAPTKNLRTVDYIPDSDRLTGTARIHSRIGEDAVINGGFQVSRLEQVGDTPLQTSVGFGQNQIMHYSANLAARIRFSPKIGMNAFFDYNQRDNEIDRSTSLFNPTLKSQIDEFIESFWRITSGVEVDYKPRSGQFFAAGVRAEWVRRDLDYANHTVVDAHMTPRNALMEPQTNLYTIYARTRLRPARGLRVAAEVGYTNAPDSGYITVLDSAGYFDFRGSYSVPTARPMTLSVFGRGEFGSNDQFSMWSKETILVPVTEVLYHELDRDFDRDEYSVGMTLSGSPADPLTLFMSAFYHSNAQDFDLVRSDFRKFKEPVKADITFWDDSPLDYRSDLVNITIGGSYRIDEDTDLSLSYAYNQSNSAFEANTATTDLLRPASRIANDIQSVETEIARWIKPGLRVLAGYRFDKFQDDQPIPAGVGSVVAPFNLSTDRHTVTVGVTMNSDFFGAP